MNHASRSFRRSLFVGLAASAASSAFATAPLEFSHSGRLLDTQGTPLNTAVTLTLTIHTSATADTNDYVATYASLQPEDGYYTVTLGGTGTPALNASLFDNNELWLGVEVDGVELSDRTRLVAVPYANTATRAENLVGAENCADGAHPRWNMTSGNWECGGVSCPSGMHLVNIAGPGDAFCITSGFASTGSWRNPQASESYCYSQGMRLCTALEANLWCQAGKPGTVGDVRFYTYEFTGNGDNTTNSHVLAFHCDSAWQNKWHWDPHTDSETRNVRCCLR